MVKISARYTGDLHCDVSHGPSGIMIATDAPKDNHGRGEAFSPTDLVAAALATCMLTVMGITANKLGIRIEGAEIEVVKSMVMAPTRRIGTLAVHVRMPTVAHEEDRRALILAAETCPVKESLLAELDVPIHFSWA